MKKLLGMILTLALAAGLAWPVYAESSTVPPEVTAHAYLVMDAQTGQVLVQKGGAERNYPASITKIMTLALAMEKCGGDMTQQVTVSPDAVYSLEAGSSHVALQPGEVVSLNDLFHATILASANDAANVLAEYTAGSMEAFVELMNAKAAVVMPVEHRGCDISAGDLVAGSDLQRGAGNSFLRDAALIHAHRMQTGCTGRRFVLSVPTAPSQRARGFDIGICAAVVAEMGYSYGFVGAKHQQHPRYSSP